MTAHTDAALELKEAADELGVHYQTAYRWVRTGRLPARLVDGKYLVERVQLAAVDEERRRPTPPPVPTPKRIGRQVDRMYDALVSGAEPDARRIARTLVDEGAPVVEVVQSVLVPPLRRIGQGWHEGKLTIGIEHRASAIVERILGELAPNPRGRRRGTALVAAVSGDQHSLPTTMAAVALREANWHVHHLGANMPRRELVAFCADHAVDVAVISLTNPGATESAIETAAELRDRGTPTIVGGPGRTLADLVAEARAA